MTNQNQTGNEQSSVVDARLAAMEDLIKSYLDSLKLSLKLQPKADEWLNLDESTLRGFTAEDCSETAFKLSQYGLYIQKEVNRHKAVHNWADSSITKIIAHKIEDYGEQYTPFLIKKAMAIRENPMARQLQEIQVLAENNIRSLDDMPRRIDSMAQNLRELSMVRRRQ